MRNLFIILFLFTAQYSVAATSEDYLEACNTSTEGRSFGSDFCDCMSEKSKHLNAQELDLLYAITTKDREGANKSLEILDIQQKTNVIKITVLGPSECNRELASQKQEASTPAKEDEDS